MTTGQIGIALLQLYTAIVFEIQRSGSEVSVIDIT